MKTRFSQFGIYLTILLIFAGTWQGCKSSKKANKTPIDDGIIEVVFLQMNDVYEIAPLSGGKVGGLARVAALRKKLLLENPNVISILAGDFLNPSLIGTMKHNGSRIKGAQMIETLNTLGLDLVTFGNHEFDLKEHELQQRLNESNFEWIVGNAHHVTKDAGTVPFHKMKDGKRENIAAFTLKEISDADGTTAKVGIFGVVLPFNKKDYVHYDSFEDAAITSCKLLREESDLIVGITHLDVADDIELAKKLTDVPLLMGGHDHTHMYERGGSTVVAKADANAKTVYVHRLTINKNTGKTSLKSELVNIDDTMPEEPETAKVVKKWTSIASESFTALGFDENETLIKIPEADPWEGRETVIRSEQTNLGQVVVEGIKHACPDADVAFTNSGSIRVDDQLSGDITQYDILRTLPFGGGIVEVEMIGKLLIKILNIGHYDNVGKGGYLQLDNRLTLGNEKGKWLLNGKPINENAKYNVAMGDFLMTGGESNLDFLNPENPEITQVSRPKPDDEKDLRRDIRQAVIAYLKSRQ